MSSSQPAVEAMTHTHAHTHTGMWCEHARVAEQVGQRTKEEKTADHKSK